MEGEMPETPKGKSGNLAEHGVAIAFAAIIMMAYAHQYLYPRTEGEKLEKRVEMMETHNREDMTVIRAQLNTLTVFVAQSIKGPAGSQKMGE